MAALAGHIADGISVTDGPRAGELVTVARDARAGADRAPAPFTVTVSLGSLGPVIDRPTRWAELGVDRLIVYVRPPFVAELRRTKDVVGRWIGEHQGGDGIGGRA